MKFIKQFFLKIKKIFIREIDTSKEIQNEENLLNEIVYEESSTIGLKPTNNLISYLQLQEGDIIWAKRYNNEEEKLMIPEGHSEGPFIVIYKENDKLICSEGTSVEKNINKTPNYFKLLRKDYQLVKETYFRLNNLKTIDESTFIEKKDELTKNDKNNLFKLIRLNGSDFYKDNQIDKKINIPLKCGDIIKNGLNYLIIDIKDNKLSCIPIPKSTSYLKRNINFNDFKNLDYSKLTMIDYNDENNYINTITDDILVYVLKKQKEYIDNYNNSKIAQRGSIIFKDNKYYYIYGEEGQNWLIFEISNIKIRGFHELEIGNKRFWVNFSDLTINKKEVYDVVTLFFREDIDKIKEIRKNYKINTKFNVGQIVKNNINNNNRYIIICVNSDIYECLSIEQIKKGIYEPVEFKKNNTNLVLSKNTSLDGISFFDRNPQFDLSKIKDVHYLNQIFLEQQQYLQNDSKKTSIQLSEVLSKIEIGEIIWAKKYDNEEQKVKKSKYYNEGLYVVLDKCASGLVCSRGSFKEPNNNNLKKYFKLNREIPGICNSIYFRLIKLKIINDYKFIKKVDRLNDFEINKIFGLLTLNGFMEYAENGTKKTINIPLKCGDIIGNGLNYLIIDIKDNKLLCIPISKSAPYLKKNINFNDFKNLDYSKLTMIDYNDKNNYINTVTGNILHYVLRDYRIYLQQLNTEHEKKFRKKI